MSASLEERVARLEARMRRGRLLALAKYAFYAVIIVGVLVYLYDLYSTMDQWKAELSDRPRLGLVGPARLNAEFYVRVYNPDGDVFAKLVYYRVYINGYYAGDGFIPYLSLPSGWSEHKIGVEIDLSRASCGVARALSSGEDLTVRLEGYAMVDLKAFGRIPWRTVTVPFNVTAAQVEPPPLDDATRALLRLYVLACDEAPRVLKVLEALGLAAGSQAPGGGGGEGGGGAAQPKLSVNATMEKLSITTYRVNVTIVNEGPGEAVVKAVYVNQVPVLEEPATIPQGGSLTLTALVHIPTATVTVVPAEGEPIVVVASYKP